MRITFSFAGNTKSCMDLAPHVKNLLGALANGQVSEDSPVTSQMREAMKIAGLKIFQINQQSPRQCEWAKSLL